MYNNSFWDTQLGNRLAHILIACLPKLVEKEQYVVTVNENESAKELIEKNIKNGAVFVNAVYENGVATLLVFEK